LSHDSRLAIRPPVLRAASLSTSTIEIRLPVRCVHSRIRALPWLIKKYRPTMAEESKSSTEEIMMVKTISTPLPAAMSLPAFAHLMGAAQ
jgi:hypothetical protein